MMEVQSRPPESSLCPPWPTASTLWLALEVRSSFSNRGLLKATASFSLCGLVFLSHTFLRSPLTTYHWPVEEGGEIPLNVPLGVTCTFFLLSTLFLSIWRYSHQGLCKHHFLQMCMPQNRSRVGKWVSDFLWATEQEGLCGPSVPWWRLPLAGDSRCKDKDPSL